MDYRVKPGNDEVGEREAATTLVIPGLDPGIHADEPQAPIDAVTHKPSNEQKTTSRTPIRDPGRQTPPRLEPWAPDRGPGRRQ